MILLPTAYLGNLQYYSKLLSGEACIDLHEHYLKQSYRNRCDILSAGGVMSLTVPVYHTGGVGTPTREIRIDYSKRWQHRHWQAIVSAYRGSPYFAHYEEHFAPLYRQRFDLLAELNDTLQRTVLHLLDPSGGAAARIGYTDRYVSPSVPSDPQMAASMASSVLGANGDAGVGAGQGGASLMPSPTMAGLAGGLQLADHGFLAVRQHPGDHSVPHRPALPMASAVRWLSPVSMMTLRPMACSSRMARGCPLDGVGHRDDTQQTACAAKEQRGLTPAPRAQLLPVPARPGTVTLVPVKAALPPKDLLAVQLGAQAVARQSCKVGHLRGVQLLCFGIGQHSAASGCSLLHSSAAPGSAVRSQSRRRRAGCR